MDARIKRRPTAGITRLANSRQLWFETLEDRRLLSVTGDYNGNFAIDAADYFLWRKSVGATGAHPADGNGDLVVNDLDHGVSRPTGITMQFILPESFSPRQPSLLLSRVSAGLGLAVRTVAFCLAAMSVTVTNAYTYTTQIDFESASPGSSATISSAGATLNVVPQGPSPGGASIGYTIQLFGSPLPTQVYYAYEFPPFNTVTYAFGSVGGVCYGTNCLGAPAQGKLNLTNTALHVQISLAKPLTPGAGSVAINFGGTDQPDEYDDEPASVYIPDGTGEATADEGADVANDTTGGYLTSTLAVAVVEDHGYSDFVQMVSPPTTPGTIAPGGSPGYFFSSSKIPFTQFIIPEALPGGDAEFKLIFGEYQSHTLQAGVPFDFTQYVPGGVTAFLLTGFNPDEGLLSGDAFPFEHGFRFAQQGYTLVRHGLLLPGDYTLGGVVNEFDYLSWRANFGRVGDHPADGNQDGIVDAADYVVWRKWQAITTNASSASGNLTTGVPEPGAATLFLTGGVVVIALVRRRHKLRMT